MKVVEYMPISIISGIVDQNIFVDETVRTMYMGGVLISTVIEIT